MTTNKKSTVCLLFVIWGVRVRISQLYDTNGGHKAVSYLMDSDYPFGIFQLFSWTIVCLSLIHGFWLPIWYLPTFLVDHCLSFFDLRILITHLVSSNFSRGPLSVFLWFTDSDYPFGIFQFFSWTIVCLSLIHGFWLPIWYLPTFLVDHCLSFFDSRILITHLVSSNFSCEPLFVN
jgi:hypothetical protein